MSTDQLAELEPQVASLTAKMRALAREAYRRGSAETRQRLLAELREMCEELAADIDRGYATISPEIVADMERMYRDEAPSPIVAARRDGVRDALAIVLAALSDARTHPDG